MAAAAGQVAPAATAWYLGLFGVGSVVMRGAGCTINDLWDRDLDEKVARTRDRPLASKQVSSAQAFVFLGGQLSLGLAVLLQLNPYSIALGAASLLPVTVYPLFKRITYYPQVVLGLTFSWGALLGWPAVLGGAAMDWNVVLPLYGSNLLWTVLYDTVYAHQDKADDRLAGVKSMALKLGDSTKWVLSALAVGQMALLATAGYMNCSTLPFYGISVGLGSMHLVRLIYSVDLNDPRSCGKWFRRGIRTGGIIATGILSDYLYRLLGDEPESRPSHDST